MKLGLLFHRRTRVGLLLAALLAAATASAQASDDYPDLWKRGEYAKALEQIDALVELRGGTPLSSWRRDRAALRRATGQYDLAIEDLEALENSYGTPTDTLDLALTYRERGRTDDYTKALERAWMRTRQVVMVRASADSLLAHGRVAELRGENPKVILNTIYAAIMQQAPSYGPAFVAAGELALRKWDYDLASEYFTKALAIDEEHQDALAGLAKCLWKSSDPRGEAVLQRLAELNPNHPGGFVLRMELALDQGDTKKALAIADAALTINPNSVEMLSLTAAARFLADDEGARARAQATALGVNGTASDVFRVPGRIASRHYRFLEGADFQKRALEIDPSDHRARALYAFDLLRLGEEAEGRAQLDRAFKDDPYNVTVFNMLNLMDSLARFDRIERGPFVLQLPSAEAPVLAEDALALVEEAYQRYTTLYEIEATTPILVQMYDDHDDFMVRSVGLPGSVGHLGICFGRLVTMDSPSARSKWTADWRSVLWHEFVHVITLQKTKNRMARWLSEGISVYEETRRHSAWGQRLDPAYKGIIANEPSPTMADMADYFLHPKSQAHVMFGYMVAGEFVTFYVEQYGFPALRDTLDRIAGGELTIPALAAASGESQKKVDKRFATYLDERFAPYANLPDIPKVDAASTDSVITSVTLLAETGDWTQLSSPFTDAMRAAGEAMKAERWDEAEASLLLADKLFPDYNGADAPLRLLIDFYDENDRRDDLKIMLRRRLARHATDFPAMRRLVELHEEEAAWADMLEVADRALGVDPFDLSMRRSALRAAIESNNGGRALTLLDQLAHIDSARVVDYKLRRAETLGAMGRWDEAKRATVLLLEETPHFLKAQNLLLKLVDRDEGKTQ